MEVNQLNKAADFFTWLGSLGKPEFERIYGNSFAHYWQKFDQECNRNAVYYYRRLDTLNRHLLVSMYPS